MLIKFYTSLLSSVNDFSGKPLPQVPVLPAPSRDKSKLLAKQKVFTLKACNFNVILRLNNNIYVLLFMWHLQSALQFSCIGRQNSVTSLVSLVYSFLFFAIIMITNVILSAILNLWISCRNWSRISSTWTARFQSLLCAIEKAQTRRRRSWPSSRNSWVSSSFQAPWGGGSSRWWTGPPHPWGGYQGTSGE